MATEVTIAPDFNEVVGMLYTVFPCDKQSVGKTQKGPNLDRMGWNSNALKKR